MSKIALVNVALIVNGERVNFKPGDTLPTLPQHDVEALTASKSIKDSADESNAARASASEQRKGDQEFQEARSRVLAETESTAAASAGAGSNAGGESASVVADGASQSIFKDISATDAAHSSVSSQKVAAPATPPARKTTPAAKTTGNGRK